MGTATILGDTYQTVVMPDGKEWLAANLAWTGAGQWWNNGASDDGDGRYYNIDFHPSLGDKNAIKNALLAEGGGWRLPTIADSNAMHAAVIAIVGAGNEGGALKSLTGWDAPNTGATDQFGFGLQAAGRKYVSSWAFKTTRTWLMLDASEYAMAFKNDWGNYVPASNEGTIYDYFVSVRLVRDYTPIFHGFEGMDFGVAPEWGYEPKITPSLSWTKTASGLWRCLDDGAAFDAYDAEITVKVSGAVHSAWESFIAANRGTQVAYFAPAGVRPFGPHIDCTAGVQVVIGDAWSTDWRVGITADCYTLHIPMRYVGGYTPTLATMPAVVARKYPTPTWFYPTKVHATEAGTATAAPRDTETQTTQVIIDNLDQAGAAAMVNWCLYQRGASFTYTPTAGCFPFGVAAGNGPFTVRLIGWTSQKPKPNRWDMTLDFAREA